MLVIKTILTFCLIFFLMLLSADARAGELAERLAHFPEWEKLTSVKPAIGDLVYPEWMEGTWQVTSTLVDVVAPLAPDIITPGFAGNQRQLNKPVSFLVRFVKVQSPLPFSNFWLKIIPKIDKKSSILVADRVYNSLNLSRAYLGDNSVLAVKVDPNSPNRQITFLRSNCQLISIISARATESTPDGEFITTEVFQQLFKGGISLFLNSVESTTAYHQPSTSTRKITANQVTAVYLSPQDPDYFTAGDRPVALYRYHLEFIPSEVPTTSED